MDKDAIAERGLFVVLEGIDGCGSSTQSSLLASWLRESGREVHPTHEPSNGPVGMLIRLALTGRLTGGRAGIHGPSEGDDVRDYEIDHHTLALLFAADRMDHLSAEIVPSLNRGRIVVCDRYILSSLAYQGSSLDEQWVVDLNRFARKPDLTIYLDVPAEVACARMRRTRWKKDLFETENQLRIIREKYSSLIQTHSEMLGIMETIDGTESVESVSSQIRTIIESHVRVS